MSVSQARSDKCPGSAGLTRSVRQTRSVKQTAMLPARQTKVSANQGKSAGMLITVGKTVHGAVGKTVHGAVGKAVHGAVGKTVQAVVGKTVQAVVGTEAHVAAEKRVTQDRHLKVLARQVSFERCVYVNHVVVNSHHLTLYCHNCVSHSSGYLMCLSA